MKNKTATRRRNKSVTFRMNEAEYKAFTDKLKETGLTQQAFLMNAVQQSVNLSEDGLREMKDLNLGYADLLRQIKGMANNINQMARWANTTGVLPTEWQLYEISCQIEDFRKESEEIWQSIRSLTTRQKHTQP